MPTKRLDPAFWGQTSQWMHFAHLTLNESVSSLSIQVSFIYDAASCPFLSLYVSHSYLSRVWGAHSLPRQLGGRRQPGHRAQFSPGTLTGRWLPISPPVLPWRAPSIPLLLPLPSLSFTILGGEEEWKGLSRAAQED